MDKVDDLNNGNEYDKAGWHSRLGTTQSFGEARAGWPTLWRQAAWIRPAASTRLPCPIWRRIRR